MRARWNSGLLVVCLALPGCGADVGPDEVSEPEPAAIEILSGDHQIQGRGRDLHEPVVVRAVDVAAAPMAGVALSFAPGPGSGSVSAGSVVTDSGGEAIVFWTLGELVGAQELSVTSAAGSAQVTVSATARQSDFDVHFVADAGLTAEQVAAIRTGTERWTDVITGDMPDFQLPPDYRPPDRCLDAKWPTLGVIDDMRIEVRIRADLASSMIVAFCEVADSPVSIRPFWLLVWVRPDFVAQLDSESRFRAWIAHVTGHGLGFGIFWGSLLQNPVDEAGVGADTHFGDSATVAAFDAAGGSEWTAGSKVPVENAEENRDVHWRGDVLGHEIMSSWYTMRMPGDNPPLSAITVQSVAALGYEVDVGMADPYELPEADAAVDKHRRSPGVGGVPRHGEFVELIYDGSRVVGIVSR